MLFALTDTFFAILSKRLIVCTLINSSLSLRKKSHRNVSLHCNTTQFENKWKLGENLIWTRFKKINLLKSIFLVYLDVLIISKSLRQIINSQSLITSITLVKQVTKNKTKIKMAIFIEPIIKWLLNCLLSTTLELTQFQFFLASFLGLFERKNWNEKKKKFT